MFSIDTNIFLHAQNSASPNHQSARDFVASCGKRDDMAICDLVLVELYLLLRNPAVVSHPMNATEAVSVCKTYRGNPRWSVIENGPVMNEVWTLASAGGFARRKIIDARLALTLLHHGVTEFATANQSDFASFEFRRVWNPLA
jgi:toxin-antitoxin system PIN domain toxin